MENEGDNLYARPIRGITPVIDLNKMEIIRFDRYGKILFIFYSFIYLFIYLFFIYFNIIIFIYISF